MAFEIVLYEFSKKENSTKTPTGGTSFSCVLKGNSGIQTPVVQLDLGTGTSPHDYNYAYIPLYNRYYFVREWTWISGLWEGVLSVDALTSFKNEILSNECYVTRASSTFNGKIRDGVYNITSQTQAVNVVQESPWNIDNLAGGEYVLGVNATSTIYYGLNSDTLVMFFAWLFSDEYLEGLVPDWANIFKNIKVYANPIQYISSLMYFPFQWAATNLESIRAGYVEAPTSGDRIGSPGIYQGSAAFTVPRHPQVSRGEYLNGAPFSSYSLFFPPWGIIPIPPEIAANSSVINAQYRVDLRTGNGTLYLYSDTFPTFTTMESQVGVPFNVGQMVSRGTGVLDAIQFVANMYGATQGALGSSAISGASHGIQTGNPAAAGAGAALSAASSLPSAAVGGINTAISGVESALLNTVPRISMVGTSGGFGSLTGLPTLSAEFHYIADEDNEHLGRPVCQKIPLSSLSGFVMVYSPEIEISGTLDEQNMIRTYLSGGMFIE